MQRDCTAPVLHSATYPKHAANILEHSQLTIQVLHFPPSRVTLRVLSQGSQDLQTPVTADSCPALHLGMQQHHLDLQVVRSPAKANSSRRRHHRS